MSFSPAGACFDSLQKQRKRKDLKKNTRIEQPGKPLWTGNDPYSHFPNEIQMGEVMDWEALNNLFGKDSKCYQVRPVKNVKV